MNKYAFLFIFGLLTIPFNASAFNNVIISEIAWMGTSASTDLQTTEDATNEWIELYNSTESDVSLEGWMLLSDDDSPKITIDTSITIPARSFVVFERTDENTLPTINGYKYVGGLTDGGENLKLKNNLGDIVDRVDAVGTSWWNLGDKTTGSRKTMERTLNDSWTTSLIINGTPAAPNSVWQTQNTTPPTTHEPPPPQPTTDTQKQTPDPTPSTTTQATEPPSTQTENVDQITESPSLETEIDPPEEEIYISELIPNPDGTDSDLEFIEIVNSGKTAVDLTGWSLSDKTKTFYFEAGQMLKPSQYLAFFAPQTHLNLNNDGDTIQLNNKNGALADGIQYGKTKEGWALAKIDGSWTWTDEPSPDKINIPSAQKQSADKYDSTENIEEASIIKAPDLFAANNSTDKDYSGSSINGSQENNRTDNIFITKASVFDTLRSKSLLVVGLALFAGIIVGIAIFVFRKYLGQKTVV